MRMRRRDPLGVKDALAAAESILPRSGELDDLIDGFRRRSGRPLVLMSMDLGSATLSGLWLGTETTNYIVHPSSASPERICTIACHEIGHALLRHEGEPLTPHALDTGQFAALPAEVVERILAARHGFHTPEEEAAELIGTHLSFGLRRRLQRGGDTFTDERWR